MLCLVMKLCMRCTHVCSDTSLPVAWTKDSYLGYLSFAQVRILRLRTFRYDMFRSLSVTFNASTYIASAYPACFHWRFNCLDTSLQATAQGPYCPFCRLQASPSLAIQADHKGRVQIQCVSCNRQRMKHLSWFSYISRAWRSVVWYFVFVVLQFAFSSLVYSIDHYVTLNNISVCDSSS